MRWYAEKTVLLLTLAALFGIGCGDVRPPVAAEASSERADAPASDVCVAVSAPPVEVELRPGQAPSEWADLSAAYDAGVAAGGSPIENLMLPIEHFDNGRVRAVLHAEQATVSDEDTVRASKVRINLFTVQGKPDGWLEAEQCLFNRKEKRGYCRGVVALELQEVVVSGKDLYWSLAQQRVVVISDARVVVKQWKRNTGQEE